jgi:dihydropteroate synthase
MSVPEAYNLPVDSATSVLDRLFTEPETRTYVTGVLNVTPDSFSDGGLYFSAEAALAKAVSVEREGGDMLDVGAESSRPGSQPLTVEEERKRLSPCSNISPKRCEYRFR